MEYVNILGITAAIIAAFSHILYVRAILKGETKPSRVTWFIWSILGIIVAASYYKSGARSTLWIPIGEAFWYSLFFLLSIKFGVGGWTKIDRVAIVGAIFSGVVWYQTGSALVALLCGLGVDFMAAIPTVYKLFRNPDTEDRLAWVFTVVGSTLNLIAINQWSFSIVVYPAYMFIMNGFITLLLFRKTEKTNPQNRVL